MFYKELGLQAVLGVGVGGPLFIHGLVLYVVLNVRKSRDEGPLIHPKETMLLGNHVGRRQCQRMAR